MIGQCSICKRVTEVREIVTINAFMTELTGSEGEKLYTCATCTNTVLTAIKQAIIFIRQTVKPS